MNAVQSANLIASPARAANRQGRAQQELRRLRATTEKLVGATFYGTLLRQMRESKLKTGLMDGGRGEEVFSAQLHAIYAERMGQSPRDVLAQRIFDTYKDQQGRVARAHEAYEGATAPVPRGAGSLPALVKNNAGGLKP